MFCSKRNSLVKRLWKYKINNETKSSSQKDTSASSSTTMTSSQEDMELKSVTHSFFKRLKEDQLRTLVQAMESKGGEITPCVPVSKSDLCLGRHMVSPYVLCCRVFRWPDLRSDVEMKRLPSCSRQNEEKESVICCNPYHWSLVVKIDEPPIHTDKLSPAQTPRISRSDTTDDGFPRIMKSTDSGMMTSMHQDDLTDKTEQSARYDCFLWCTVAYWELRERVGRLFSVTEPSIHIFQHLPHGDGMCLRLFQKPTNLEVVKRTREKIGFGIILSREAAHSDDVTRTLEKREKVTALELDEGIVMSPLLPPSSLTSSLKKTSPCRTAESIQISQIKDFSTSPVTSNSKMMTLTHGVGKIYDNLDSIKCAQDAGGGDRVRQNVGFDESRIDNCQRGAGCGAEEVQQFQEQHQHLCGSDSTQICSLSNESMDYTATTSTSSTSQHLLSPSSLSSASLSPGPSSLSPPMYISDTSYLHYSSTSADPGAIISSATTTQIINNKTNINHSNNQNNSNKRTTTGTSSESCSKSSRTTDPTPTTRTTPSSQTTATFFTAVSSNLPCKQGEVWAYNASNFPIFVNSPTLDDPQSPRSLVVKKVPPGYSIKIFDYARAELLERTEARSMLLNDGPFDPCSVRISLAKGWGPSYSRQFITSCPCWLEVLLGVRSQTAAS